MTQVGIVKFLADFYTVSGDFFQRYGRISAMGI